MRQCLRRPDRGLLHRPGGPLQPASERAAAGHGDPLAGPAGGKRHHRVVHGLRPGRRPAAAQGQLDACSREVCPLRVRRRGAAGAALMAPLLGVLGGAGLLLVWWSAWEQPQAPVRPPRVSRLEDLLRAAGIEKVSRLGLLATCCGVGAFVTLVFFTGTRSWPISACFGLFGGWMPLGLVKWRARKRSV